MNTYVYKFAIFVSTLTLLLGVNRVFDFETAVFVGLAGLSSDTNRINEKVTEIKS